MDVMYTCQCGRRYRTKVQCLCGKRAGMPPRWVLAVAAWAKPGEKGVGDTFHRLAAKVGADHVERLIKWFDVECGCSGRRSKWNRLYPYGDDGSLI